MITMQDRFIVMLRTEIPFVTCPPYVTEITLEKLYASCHFITNPSYIAGNIYYSPGMSEVYAGKRD